MRRSQARAVVHEYGAEIPHDIYHEKKLLLLVIAFSDSNWVFLPSCRQEIVDFSGISKIGIGGVGYLKVS